MNREQAIALIANSAGWSRMDILEAAQVLRAELNTTEVKLSTAVEPYSRSMARDDLLLAMADVIGSDGSVRAIRNLSDAMENFRKGR